MKGISIVIPAFNEEKRIGKTLERLWRFLKTKKFDFEIVVVFDGADRTVQVVRDFAKSNGISKRVRVLKFPVRLGKGGGLMKGLAVVRRDLVLVMDADASVPPSQLIPLLNALDDNDIAIGSRYLTGSKTEISPVRRTFSSAFRVIARLLFNMPYRDTQCGFKAFRLAAVKKLLPLVKTTDFCWDVDVLLQARKLGLRVKEVPIEWSLEGGGTITSKNGLQTALRMFATLLKLRFRG